MNHGKSKKFGQVVQWDTFPHLNFAEEKEIKHYKLMINKLSEFYFFQYYAKKNNEHTFLRQ